MSLSLEDLAPPPPERFPQAVAERRFALVAVSEFVIGDLIQEGLEGREFRAEVEGLPEGAVVCGIYPDPQTASVILRFVHPDLARAGEGYHIVQLQGTISIVEREEPEPTDPEVHKVSVGPGQLFETIADWIDSLPFHDDELGTTTYEVGPGGDE